MDCGRRIAITQMLLSGFYYFRFEAAACARPARSNAACSVLSPRVFGGYGVHTSTSPTVAIALGNGPDDAL